jgi:hypothetical protein
MATTSGLVQRLWWFSIGPVPVACVWVGSFPSSAELFFLQIPTGSSVADVAFKRSMLDVLVEAQMTGYRVEIGHGDDSAEVTSVTVPGFDICPVGIAVHDDFYVISGAGIPADAEIVFESASLVVTVVPDLVRPHLVMVDRLPAAVPAGRNSVRLEASGWSSDAVPVEVAAGPATTVRTLYSGAPKTRAYTVAFVANPAIEAETGGGVSADPVLTDRNGYHDAVRYSLVNLLTQTEDLLRQNGIDRHIRFVSVFDATLPAQTANALAHEFAPNLMETRRDRLNPFLGRFNIQADYVSVLHASTTHTRATAWFTTDDAAQAGTAYTYDGANRTHGHFPQIPGSSAIPITVNQTGLTALHEFGHAGSDFNNGRVVDLYVDGGGGGSIVNRKARAQSTDPIPAQFANYNATGYASDQNRDSISYPPTWISYHPELIDPTRPNLMDNYWQAFDDPLRCRLDRLTYAWYSDRLRAKIFR